MKDIDHRGAYGCIYVRIPNCTASQADVIRSHETTVDSPFFWQPVDKWVEVALRSKYCTTDDDILQAIDWLREDILEPHEVIKYDWSDVLQSALDNADDTPYNVANDRDDDMPTHGTISW